MKKFVIIDGHSILYRAYHAIPKLSDKKGNPINAVYGFVSMVLKTLNELNPDYVAVTFDMPGGTFRNELYKDYQAHRKKPDDDFIVQIKTVHELLEVMKFPVFEVQGYEADDVIGTITSNVKCQMSNVKCIVVTSDRDQLQLVNDRVRLLMPVKSLGQTKLYGVKETKERMGVGPDHVADLKGLAGDPSDNIPGILGIGPKTASVLINRFGSIEEVYNHIDELEKKSVKEKLVNGRDMALLSKKLATIVTSVPIKFAIETCKLPDLVRPEVVEYFHRLGLKTLVRRLTGKSSQNDRKNKLKHNVEKKAYMKKKDQMKLF